jgi:hypothetical protein
MSGFNPIGIPALITARGGDDQRVAVEMRLDRAGEIPGALRAQLFGVVADVRAETPFKELVDLLAEIVNPARVNGNFGQCARPALFSKGAVVIPVAGVRGGGRAVAASRCGARVFGWTLRSG